MSILDDPTFYPSWPSYGKKLSFQWGESRTNADTMKPVANGIAVDLGSQGTRDGAVAAWEVGEVDFHNKFRTFFDKIDSKFKIQFNQGTTNAPDWLDCLLISESGRVQIIDGLEVNSGFYGVFIGDIAEAGVGALNSYLHPTALKFNVENGFYLSSDSSGNPIVNQFFTSITNPLLTTLNANNNRITNLPPPQAATDAARAGDIQPGFYGVVFKTTGINPRPIKRSDTLLFNRDSFYITREPSTGKPVINTTGSMGGGTVQSASNLGLGEGQPFAQLSGSDLQFRSITGTGSVSVSQNATTITIAGTSTTADPGFYGIIIKTTGGTTTPKRNDTLIFNRDNFYISREASTNKPVVNWTGPSNTTASNLGAGTGLVFAQKVGNDLQFRSIAGGGIVNVSEDSTTITITATATDPSPGFYGVVFKTTGPNPQVKRNDTLIFNRNDFYISREVSTNKPVINWTGASSTTASNVGTGEGQSFAQKVNNDLQFRSITGAGTVAVSQDSSLITITGTPHPGFYGIIVKTTDGGTNPQVKRNDTILFNRNDFYISREASTNKPVINWTGTSSTTASNQGSGTGQSFIQKVGNDLQFRSILGTGIVSVTQDSTTITVNATATDPSPGFYGIIVRTTDGGTTPAVFRNDTLIFNRNNFYITPAKTALGKPVVNFRAFSNPGAGVPSEQFGAQTYAVGNNSVAFGYAVVVSGDNTVGVGSGITSSGSTGVVIGTGASVSGAGSTAVGSSSMASTNGCTALGSNASASNTSCTAIGTTASASGSSSFALGANSSATNSNSIVIGAGATDGGFSGVVVVGTSTISGNNSIGIGPLTSAAQGAVAIGNVATATSNNSVAIGNATSATANTAIAIGSSSNTNSVQAIVIGGATASAAGQLIFGRGISNNNQRITDVYIGGISEATASPLSTVTVGLMANTGTDRNAPNMVLRPGLGTGAGASGFFAIHTAPPGTSGTTAHTYTERLRITALGKVGIGKTAPTANLEVGGSTRSDSFTGGGFYIQGQPSGNGELLIPTFRLTSAAPPPYQNNVLRFSQNDFYLTGTPSDRTAPVVNLRDGYAKLATFNTYTKAQVVFRSTLTSGASITPDFSLSNQFTVTLDQNTTIQNPTNLPLSGTYIIIIKQDSVGSRTVAWGTNYKWVGGAPTASTTANAVDVVTLVVDNSSLYAVMQKNFV